MRRLLITAALLATTVTMAGRAPAPAAGPRPTDELSPYSVPWGPQIPTNARPWDRDEADARKHLRRRYDAGMRHAHIWVTWSDLEPTEGAFDFAGLDDFVGWARDEGTRIDLQVMTGDWSLPRPWALPTRTNPRHPVGLNVPGEDLGPVVRFWTALVDRYRPGGSLAQERAWTDGYGITNYEVENEPQQLPWWGTWGKVPKDYAAYLAAFIPVVKQRCPECVFAAPSLAQGDAESPVTGLDGIPWLREMLSETPSQWQSSTYDADPVKPAGGPFIDAYSWHYDFVNVTDFSVPIRAQRIRETVDSFATQPRFPTRYGAPLWYTEGGALGYQSDPERFAHGELQLMAQLHGAGVSRMTFETGIEPSDEEWATSPLAAAYRTISSAFPRAGRVVRADFDVAAPSRVIAYRYRDPATGKRAWLLWAPNDPDGGEPFSAIVPARGTVEVMGGDFTFVTGTAPAAGVTVDLETADPSPVVMVREL